jgi:two-component system nitrate/nitrite response regulator NarL
MNIVVLTAVRLLGDGLAACLASQPDIAVVAVVDDLSRLRAALATAPTNAVLVDVTQSIDLWDATTIAHEWPGVTLVALGLAERRQDVIKCGQSGYAGYVRRDASIDELCAQLRGIVDGKLPCSPEIASWLWQALAPNPTRQEKPVSDPQLTLRESQVLELVGQGFSNKEIASALNVSVATVKIHVHHVLEKMQVTRRSEAMRRVRDAPWLGRNPTATNGKAL